MIIFSLISLIALHFHCVLFHLTKFIPTSWAWLVDVSFQTIVKGSSSNAERVAFSLFDNELFFLFCL